MKSELKCSNKIREFSMSLDLSCQNLKSVPYIDPSLCIHTLILAGNQICEIKGIPDSVVNLDLSENQICEIKGIPDSVVNLDLYGNKITRITNIPPGLKILDLRNNLIKKVENIFGEIEKLNISENQITKLPVSMLKLNKLKELDYRSNPIQSVNVKLLAKLNKLKIF